MPRACKARTLPIELIPLSYFFADQCSVDFPLHRPTPKMVRRPGIEPGPPAWKAGILTTELTTLLLRIYFKMVTGGGFEPTPPKRLVPKTSALDHSATQPDL